MLTNRNLTPEQIKERFTDSVTDLLDRFKQIEKSRKKDTDSATAHYLQKEIDKWFVENGR